MSINPWIKCGIPTQWSIIQPQKRWSSDTCYNMDKSWKYYAERKLTQKAAYVWLYDSIYIVWFHLYEVFKQI